MANGYPETWRTLVVSDDHTIEYAEPTAALDDHTTNELTVRAFRDYERLRRVREAWLHLRLEGEAEFLTFATDPNLDDERRLADPPPDLALPKPIDFATLLLPQSMTHGWLTRQNDLSTNGARVWDGMLRYDSALLICMHACFQVTSTIAVRADAGDSPVDWLLYGLDLASPIGPSEEDAVVNDERTRSRLHREDDTAPLTRAANPAPAHGIALLHALFAAFVPAALPPDYTASFWNTVRHLVSRMMRAGDEPHARAEWLLRKVRAGLLGLYIRNNNHIPSVFPQPGQLIWNAWHTLEPDADAFVPGSNAHGIRSEILSMVRSVLYEDEPLPAAIPMLAIVQYDRNRRAMSVFYAPAAAPLVIAAACAVGYLRAVNDGNVLPGTDVPGSEPFIASAPRTSAPSLRALTSYTLARLHATLGGNIVGPYPHEHADQWSPADSPNLVATDSNDTAVTAEKLLRTWQQSAEPDRLVWVRALEAGLLFMVGGEPEEEE